MNDMSFWDRVNVYAGSALGIVSSVCCAGEVMLSDWHVGYKFTVGVVVSAVTLGVAFYSLCYELPLLPFLYKNNKR